jgi:hypothetical protein
MCVRCACQVGSNADVHMPDLKFLHRPRISSSLAKTRQNNYRTLRITKIQAVRRGGYQERICALETHAPIRDTVVPVRQFHWELSEPRRKDPSYVRLIIPGG